MLPTVSPVSLQKIPFRWQCSAGQLEQANRYLQEDFLSWWNQHLAVIPANPADAHRTLDKTCNLDSILSCVDTRQVASDYTIRFQGKIYQMARSDVRTGLRGGMVRIEVRLDGTVHARFQEKYLAIQECQQQPKQQPPIRTKPTAKRPLVQPSEASRKGISGIARGGMPVWQAAQINKTRG